MSGYQHVTCRECGQSGQIQVGRRLRSGKHNVEDRVPHTEECSKYKRRQPRHLRKRRTYSKQEERAGALVGARLTAASGALGMDGDARDFHRWRIEAKYTSSDKYFLTQAVWEKLVQGADAADETPMLHVELRRGGAYPIRRVIVTRRWFRDHDLRGIRDPEGGKRRHKVTDTGVQPLRVDLRPPGVDIPETLFKRLLNESKE